MGYAAPVSLATWAGVTSSTTNLLFTDATEYSEAGNMATIFTGYMGSITGQVKFKFDVKITGHTGEWEIYINGSKKDDNTFTDTSYSTKKTDAIAVAPFDIITMKLAGDLINTETSYLKNFSMYGDATEYSGTDLYQQIVIIA